MEVIFFFDFCTTILIAFSHYVDVPDCALLRFCLISAVQSLRSRAYDTILIAAIRHKGISDLQ
jgi:hypothetical protein